MINKHFIYLNLALNIAGSVSVTAAIRRKFPPVILYKPIDRPAVSDEKLFAVSSPATKSVNTNTNPPVRKQIIVRFLSVVVLKGEKFRCKNIVRILLVLHHHLGPVHTVGTQGSDVGEVNVLTVFAIKDSLLLIVPDRNNGCKKTQEDKAQLDHHQVRYLYLLQN